MEKLQPLRCSVVWMVGVAALATWGRVTWADDELNFDRHVRPILAEHCFRCHGPDAEHREANLRLDQPAGIIADLGGHAAVVPGRPDESELIRRIVSTDDDERMPPAEAKRSLRADEIARLRQWVALGAPWSDHWAFVAPRARPLPTTTDREHTYNPIDVFVLHRLAQMQPNLQPAPRADIAMLMRRVMLDLIGLPPTPEDMEAFVRDDAPDAYERLVERLLASPAYGERWARTWLDLARYADTNGYEKDRERTIWPYRDWVINALNADMPYDQFTLEQLAGDLLPNASVPQRIATGFHRNTMLNEEGGIDPLEYRFYAMNDRVATTGVVWLGLTVGCAQCHTHKYDPITQREYYGLMALLNNAYETDLAIVKDEDPLPYQQRLQEAERLARELSSHWPATDPQGQPSPALEEAFADWLKAARKQVVPWTTLTPSSADCETVHLTIEADGSVFAKGDPTKYDHYRLTIPLNQPGHPQLKTITSVRLDALPDPRLPGGGPGLVYYEGPKGDFFLQEFRLFHQDAPVKIARATHSDVFDRTNQQAIDKPQLFDGRVNTGFSIRNADTRVQQEELFPDGHRVVFVMQLAEPLRDAIQLRLELDFDHYYAASLGKFRILATGSTDDPPVTAHNYSPEIETLLGLPDSELSPAQGDRLREEFLLNAPPLKSYAQRVVELRQPLKVPQTLVMQERPRDLPRPTFLHTRGEYTLPTERVEPHLPSVFLGASESEILPRTRLDLARWLISRNNPLAARVWVNRHWAAFFGRGLVPTLDDFGTQGERPTHPELLDWLAVWGMQHEWSTKELHRLIVTSFTYQQSATVTPDHRRSDPQNLWLSHMSRRRLDGEAVRDAVLSTCGLLSHRMGGPGVRPPQPGSVVAQSFDTPEWQPDVGDNRYRRSLYTFQKRTAPFAMYVTFDAPSGEACVARRDVSNTPLQALTLLNDEMFIEAARELGRQLHAVHGDDTSKITRGMQHVLSRAAAPWELPILLDFVARQRQLFQDDAGMAATLLGGAADEDTTEVAVWTALSRTIFNLDEAVTRN